MAETSQAVIIPTGTGRLTAAPGGKLANSGWQYEGQWLDVTGTPIAANYFVTARHAGGNAGQTFILDGKSFQTTAFYDAPNSDLRIVKVDGTFDAFASLYRTTKEKGKQFVVFGRGTDRGDAVTRADNPAKPPKLKGFLWGAKDSSLSWGTNQVSKVLKLGGQTGDVLSFTFDSAKKKTTEAALSENDSGGGIFILDKKQWKLAGINFGAEGKYTPTGSLANQFSAALFDKGGYYSVLQDNSTVFNPDKSKNIPSLYTATRVSSNLPWIDAVLAGQVAPSSVFTPAPAEPIAPDPTNPGNPSDPKDPTNPDDPKDPTNPNDPITPEPASASLLLAAGLLLTRRRT